MSGNDIDDVDQSEVESLRKIGALKESFNSLAQELPELPQHIRAAVHDLSERIGALYEIAAENLSDAAIAADEAISDHPWVGFWVGVGAGLVALQVFRRIRES